MTSSEKTCEACRYFAKLRNAPPLGYCRCPARRPLIVVEAPSSCEHHQAADAETCATCLHFVRLPRAESLGRCTSPARNSSDSHAYPMARAESTCEHHNNAAAPAKCSTCYHFRERDGLCTSAAAAALRPSRQRGPDDFCRYHVALRRRTSYTTG